jgi:hypothetical protein
VLVLKLIRESLTVRFPSNPTFKTVVPAVIVISESDNIFPGILRFPSRSNDTTNPSLTSVLVVANPLITFVLVPADNCPLITTGTGFPLNESPPPLVPSPIPPI